jgi:predicted DNA-binding protein
MPDLHPQFLTDADGKPLSVLLPIAEYTALIERIEDLEDLDDAREALSRIERGEQETIPWEAIKAEHGL